MLRPAPLPYGLLQHAFRQVGEGGGGAGQVVVFVDVGGVDHRPVVLRRTDAHHNGQLPSVTPFVLLVSWHSGLRRVVHSNQPRILKRSFLFRQTCRIIGGERTSRSELRSWCSACPTRHTTQPGPPSFCRRSISARSLDRASSSVVVTSDHTQPGKYLVSIRSEAGLVCKLSVWWQCVFWMRSGVWRFRSERGMLCVILRRYFRRRSDVVTKLIGSSSRDTQTTTNVQEGKDKR